MLVAHLLAGPVEDEVLPVANAWHELGAQDVCEAKERRTLAVRIDMHRVASYTFEDDAFIVTDRSGVRVILGYPIADLLTAERRALRQI